MRFDGELDREGSWAFRLTFFQLIFYYKRSYWIKTQLYICQIIIDIFNFGNVRKQLAWWNLVEIRFFPNEKAISKVNETTILILEIFLLLCYFIM